jgi:two-component system, LytTR family, response regulator LytT
MILKENAYKPTADKEISNTCTTLLGYVDDKIIPISVKKIKFIYSSGTSVYAHTISGRNINLKSSLDHLQANINTEQFFRANRQFIINRKYIDYLEPYFNRRLLIRLTSRTPENIIVSKARVSYFLAWLQRH